MDSVNREAAAPHAPLSLNPPLPQGDRFFPSTKISRWPSNIGLGSMVGFPERELGFLCLTDIFGDDAYDNQINKA